VLAIGLAQARRLKAYVLIGALHPDLTQALKLMSDDVAWLEAQTSETNASKALSLARVCGFTVCPPRGQDLTQEQMRDALVSVLDLGLPTAIYQLPQITFNEISPELAGDLAGRYPNFVFFKDTSGSDKVALSGTNLHGVFTARGAEGDYARWLKAAGGPYAGFLLSSANCFARELAQIITEVSSGRSESAAHLSRRVGTAIAEVFRLAGDLPHGNPFANGNKAIDHFFAYGPEAERFPAPRLHAGVSLPAELIGSVGAILRREELMPEKGYMR
jgi:dihydrodipicolinate synthase/N-acetylneuraminate lyase